ncbi:hypothetical protein UPYG_G00111420 [Umbra pygmaea]|uniref:Uncharacterized protein n=1 Tax=Umbra pygmaea TaxID=75934 RepID=A0ABD0XSM5_UMBPY
MMHEISNLSQLPSFNGSRDLCPGWSPNRRGTRRIGWQRPVSRVESKQKRNQKDWLAGPSMMPGISNPSQLHSFNGSRDLCPGWSPNRRG